MEIISAILVPVVIALTPVVVSGLTGGLKLLPVFANMSDSARTPAVRALAALVSVVYVLFGAWISPANFDPNILTATVQAAGLAFAAWASSLGVFHGLGFAGKK